MPVAQDMDLVREFARGGSETAFAQLVRRHLDLVYSVALRFTGNRADSEDVVQAVFIILAQKAAGLRERTVLTGWLYETTRFTAMRAVRSRVRRHAREQEAAMESTLNEADTDAVWCQFAPHLEAAMARLSAADRTLVALRYYEKKTAAEAAAELGIGVHAAHKRTTRALEKLRRFFGTRGLALATATIANAISAKSVQAAPVSLAEMIPAVAAAKGAAASGSTLALVKGALRLMSWTQAKTALAVTSLVLVGTVGTVTVADYLHQTPSAEDGRGRLPTGDVRPMAVYSYSRAGILLASDGSLWSWGENRLGWPVLGLEDTNIQQTASLRRIGHDTDWVYVAAGSSHCLGIKSNGTVWAWGANYSYQLGDGTTTTRPTPVPSVPGDDWEQVACGGARSLGLKKDGTLWTWGDDGVGQSSTPKQVGKSAGWKRIWAGGIQYVGLQSDGSLWFWGSRIGDGNAGDAVPLPVRISPDTNWVDVCFGYFTVFAIKSDGTLWCWGNMARFYSDDLDAVSRFKPARVGNDDDWQSCHSGEGGFYQLLRKKDDSLWALDASEHRQVKPDTEYPPVKFIKIGWHKDIAAFTAGGDNVGVIITHDGEVWTWGRVLGELSRTDDRSPNGESLHPKGRTIQKPWRLPIVGE